MQSIECERAGSRDVKIQWARSGCICNADAGIRIHKMKGEAGNLD